MCYSELSTDSGQLLGDLSLLCHWRNDAGFALTAMQFKLHSAVSERVQREVAAHADTFTRRDAHAGLADDDVAAAHDLAAVALDAAALALAIPPVFTAAESFLVSHDTPRWRSQRYALISFTRR